MGRTTNKLVHVLIHLVVLNKDFKIDGEISPTSDFDFDFMADHDVYIVGLTASEIYKIIGEDNIVSVSKIVTQAFKKHK